MISRRVLIVGSLAAGALGSCSLDKPEFLDPAGPQVLAAEAARQPGAVREFRLEPRVSEVDLGGTQVTTWTYGGRIPGQELRVKAGEQVRAVVANRLTETTSVHWHGIRLRNDNDGVPGVTQEAIAAGTDYTYQFTAAHPGTYWLHPHAGMQTDRGLYAPLIVDDPQEPLSYDDEWIIVLDDWIDGLGTSPEQVFAQLRKSRGHMMGGNSGGDVVYPHYLLGGRVASDPRVYQGKPGQRIRLRIINAASDTAFRVAIGGHQMTVTHTDGYPIEPVVTTALMLGMGERYDALVTLGDGAFPITAVAEGKSGNAFGLIRTAGGQAPPSSARPAELGRVLIGYPEMKARAGLAERKPGQNLKMTLTGGMMSYDWGINGRAYDRSRITPLDSGERVRIDFANATMMFHPVHLHGHSFAVGRPDGPVKDTAIVQPGQTVPVYFDTDNPGLWMLHCHNTYHAEAGMMTLLGYRR